MMKLAQKIAIVRAFLDNYGETLAHETRKPEFENAARSLHEVEMELARCASMKRQ